MRLRVTARLPIEDVLDDFFAAIAEQGKPAPEEPISAEDLATVAEAVAPLLLPTSLVATWRRFQSGDSTVLTWMPMLPALLGLELWRQDFPAAVLFPLAYESHEFLLVELATSTTPGGALFRWAYDASPAQPVFPDLETAFTCAAEGWRRGVLSSWESPAQDDWTRLSATYSQAADYPEHLAPFEAIDLARPLSWPPVWQEASGIDPAAAEPRGSTTTIRALRDRQAGSGTIVGRIAGLSGTAAGSRAVVDDGTGELVVWCPAVTNPFGAVVSGQTRRAGRRAHVRRRKAIEPRVRRTGGRRQHQRHGRRSRRRPGVCVGAGIVSRPGGPQTRSPPPRARLVKRHGGGRRSCERNTTRRSQRKRGRPIRDSNPCLGRALPLSLFAAS
jgi:hypothetical protein